MNREEFDKLYLGKAVHCDTEEKTKEFLALADSVEYKWMWGESLIKKFAWEPYGKETCFIITSNGFLFSYREHLTEYQIIEYQLPPKFKVGDRIRIKDTVIETFNGEVGVIVDVDTLSPLSYSVKFSTEEWTWWFYENQIEKFEEQICKEETIDDIIEEIKEHQKSINVLLNRLNYKLKKGEIK